MKRYRVEFSTKVEAEILASAAYIAGDSPENAAAWLDGIYEAIASLSRLPKRCGLIREHEEFSVELRELIYKSHRIIFTVDADKVRILHVRHSARREWRGK